MREQEAHRARTERLHDLFAKGGFEVTDCYTDSFTLRYADGSAFLRTCLGRLGFLDGWRGVLQGTDQEEAVFRELEVRLNQLACESDGGLCLSIPAAYIEGRRK